MELLSSAFVEPQVPLTNNSQHPSILPALTYEREGHLVVELCEVLLLVLLTFVYLCDNDGIHTYLDAHEITVHNVFSYPALKDEFYIWNHIHKPPFG